MSQNILNLNIAGFYYHIIISEKRYLTQFLKEYSYSNNRKCDGIIIIKPRKIDKSRVEIDTKKQEAIIFVHGLNQSLDFNYLSYLVETSIASLALKKDILFLHASSLVKDGKAYTFCGKVGAGKSTVRNLASDLPSLSDDTTIIRKGKDNFFVYPSPFDKQKVKKMIYQKFPLIKILLLQKAKLTRMQFLDVADRYQELVRYNLLSQIGNLIESKNEFYKLNLDLAVKTPIQKLYFTKSKDFLKKL